MDPLNVCTCGLSGCAIQEVFELAPCPPPFFYSEFAGYALGEALCMREICEIATRCMRRFLTNNSLHIIDSICSPQTTTEVTTTPTDFTTSTNLSSSATSFTSSPTTITTSGFNTTVLPTKSTESPVASAGCNLVCVIALLISLAVISAALVVLFKCRRNIQIGKWTSFNFNEIRRRTDRRRLFFRQDTENQVSYDNINNTFCYEKKEALEIQERTSSFGNVRGVIIGGRISKTEVDLHIKAVEEEVIPTAMITDEVKQQQLLKTELIEQEVLHSRSEVSFDLEMQEIRDKSNDLTSIVIELDLHKTADRVDCAYINAHPKYVEKDKTKENIGNCDGEATKNIQESQETTDDETSVETTDEEDKEENSRGMSC